MRSTRFDPRNPRLTRLSGLELRNFKSVVSSDIPIGPLTVVAGSNSSGKSSLLQSVLALTQVARRRIVGRRFPLNDDLAQLGTFASLRHQDASPIAPVSIGAQFSSDERDVRLNSLMRTRVGGAARHAHQGKEYPVDVRWSLEMDSAVEGQIGSADISAIEVSLEGESLDFSCRIERTSLMSQIRSQRDEIDGALAFSGIIRSGRSETPVLDALISSGQAISFFGQPPAAPIRVHDWFLAIEEGDDIHDPVGEGPDPERERAIQQAAWAIREDIAATPEFTALYLSLDDTAKETLETEVLQAFENDQSRFRFGDGSIERLEGRGASWLGGAQRACARYLASQVRYVGPLRHAPHQPFSTAPDPDAGDVGVTGQYVASVLQANQSVIRQFPVPPQDQSAGMQTEELTLGDAVVRWLSFFGLADSLVVREDTPLVLGIDVIPPGLKDPVPLGAVGVGVSQVLPVVVQCLVAGPGALVLLEQPELHLHPGAQQLLADFLLACMSWGQNILVESHSEYLVLRLRRRIAEDLSDSLLSQVVLLFAERESDRTNYRRVELTPTGGVVDWPDGFFDQGPDEAHQLLIAAANRQRQHEGESNAK